MRASFRRWLARHLFGRLLAWQQRVIARPLSVLAAYAERLSDEEISAVEMAARTVLNDAFVRCYYRRSWRDSAYTGIDALLEQFIICSTLDPALPSQRRVELEIAIRRVSRDICPSLRQTNHVIWIKPKQ